MRKLDNIQKSIFEIRTLIQAIPEVRKMVFYDTANALNESIPTAEQAKEHFTVSAVFDVTKPPFNKNTIISISLTRGNYDDGSTLIRGTIRINILTRSPLWELNNNKIRPLEIGNYIIEELNNKKISPSHKLFFSSLELAILDEEVNGYTLTFLMEEGAGLDEQF